MNRLDAKIAPPPPKPIEVKKEEKPKQIGEYIPEPVCAIRVRVSLDRVHLTLGECMQEKKKDTRAEEAAILAAFLKVRSFSAPHFNSAIDGSVCHC